MGMEWAATSGEFGRYLLATEKSQGTVRTYQAAVSLFFRWAFDHEFLPEQANKMMCEQFIAEQRAHVSNFTARNRLYAIRAFFHFCVSRGLRYDDPSRELSVKKPKPLPKKPLGIGDQRRLVFGCLSPRDQAMWTLLIDTGIR